MQRCNDPSFFLASTIMLHHGDWLGCIAPASNMSRSEAHTSKSGESVHLNCYSKGLLSIMWISCSITLVQPSSFPSSTKISWKAATVAFQVVQSLTPSRFSFSSNFYWHTDTDKGSCTASTPRATSISGDSFMGGTGEAETTLATSTAFFRKIGEHVLDHHRHCYCSS